MKTRAEELRLQKELERALKEGKDSKVQQILDRIYKL